MILQIKKTLILTTTKKIYKPKNYSSDCNRLYLNNNHYLRPNPYKQVSLCT